MEHLLGEIRNELRALRQMLAMHLGEYSFLHLDDEEAVDHRTA